MLLDFTSGLSLLGLSTNIALTILTMWLIFATFLKETLLLGLLIARLLH